MGLLNPLTKIITKLNYNDICKVLCIHKCYSQLAESNSLSVKKSLDGGVLQKTSDDVSSVTPFFPKTFNLAAYVNTSETLQSLIHLNVDLNKIEKKPYVVEKILKLDFDKDMKNHIMFLKDYVELEQVGNFLTKNPLILCESLEDLQVRINYLQSKRFTDDEIKRIISKNPFWLMISTIRIDRRLGYFQKCLELQGTEVRQLASKQPKLITYNLHHINTNLFVLKEEIGFNEGELKTIVLDKPKLLMINQKSLLERFNYIHNIMKISHETILKNPIVLFHKTFKIKQRHLFLEKLGRAQYDPKKENYVPLISLVTGNDVDFCNKIAKCTVSDFNMFLKTL